jgi:hypothetical protein
MVSSLRIDKLETTYLYWLRHSPDNHIVGAKSAQAERRPLSLVGKRVPAHQSICRCATRGPNLVCVNRKRVFLQTGTNDPNQIEPAQEIRFLRAGDFGRIDRSFMPGRPSFLSASPRPIVSGHAEKADQAFVSNLF